ncbi:MAG TPA: ABC transporter substrate-binding protein, partial [Symbiobacteriaceae bacterium]|nr:ABC transporter substrate-binding protein [Symbiobacteriaceae bacterium]
MTQEEFALHIRRSLTDVAVHHMGIVEDAPPRKTGPGEVRIGIQFGIAYAPAVLVQALGLVERRLPGTRVVLRQFGSGAEVTQALAAGELDVGIMGVAPFLSSWAAGRPWRIAAALGDTPIALNTVKPGVLSLRNVAPTDRIALPGIGSMQHIVLAMAAEQQLGLPRILDANLIALDHPQGEQALLAGMVAFHLSAPPFQDREVRAGARRLFDSYQIMGGSHTLNVAVVPRTFIANRPDAYNAFTDALAEAVALIQHDPVSAAVILQRGGESGTVAEIVAALTGPGIRWTGVTSP